MGKRIVFLDYMRVIACFMVVMVHSCEFFFIDGANIGIRTPGDGFWVSVIDSAFRCSVPLFVISSCADKWGGVRIFQEALCQSACALYCMVGVVCNLAGFMGGYG